MQERNSASLLFSALVGRIFGVKRDTHEFSLKNALTTRMFFQRYRSLFGLVCEELRSAAHLIRTTRGSLSPDEAALYPVLVMLAKLQPPPSTSGFDEFPVSELARRVRILSRNGSSIRHGVLSAHEGGS